MQIKCSSCCICKYTYVYGKLRSRGTLESLSCSQFLSVQHSNGMLTLIFIPNLFPCLILEEIFAVYPVSRIVSNCQYFCTYISQSPQSAHWTENMYFIYMISHSLCSSVFLYFNYSKPHSFTAIKVF